MKQMDKYKSFIRSLPAGKLTKENLFVPELLIKEYGNMSIYYIPFDYVNEHAKVMIVGITPGFTQMQMAFAYARESLLAGMPADEIDKGAKKLASFAGSMRKNLIEMLNEIELPLAIGIESSESLFEDQRDLLHTTSVIRYPVFQNGKNYTGHSPSIMKSDILYYYADSILLQELVAVKDALVIPLGKAASEVIQAFADDGFIQAERCLYDLPHPSGANGHRKKQFEHHKTKLMRQVVRWFSHR